MPHFSFIAPLANPLNVRSTMNALMPEGSRCFFFSASVHANTRKWSATLASEIQLFSPVITYRLPFLTAVVWMPARIAARRRFGQGVAGDLRPLRLRHQISLLLILGAPRQQREPVQAGVDRHDDAQRRIDVFELFADQAQRDVVHAGAAVFGGHRRAQQPELRHPAQYALAIEAMLAVVFPDVRRDVARGPLADRLLEEALLVGEGEIDHE